MAALLLGALGTSPARAQWYQVLHGFAPGPPRYPYAAPIADSAGNLYGTTASGGTLDVGTVFKLDASNGYALTTLHSFAGPDGGNPQAALIADSSGNLYGTTVGGGGASGNGTVFKLDASNGYALTTLHSFAYYSDGGYPYATLIADSAGNLYGTTTSGGLSGFGTVFKLDASNGYALTTLHSFTGGSDGAGPYAALIADSAGNLYGTTEIGGASGNGTVFKLDASNGYALTTLHIFAYSDGAYPYAGLIADPAGNLYGTTVFGGAVGYGTVFKLDASNGYALTTLHSFAYYSDGGNPYAALIAGTAGNVYGTTFFGGPNQGAGTVFKLDASNGYALTTLHSFTGGSDGAGPYAALIADSAGNLYGTTQQGGASSFGTVFKLDASNGYALTTLQNFTGSEGANPYAALVADSVGNLYGTTSSSKSGSGTVFKLDALNEYALTTLHYFFYSDGANPLAALITDTAGNLYGTTVWGGGPPNPFCQTGCGTVFKLDVSNSYALTTLHSFSGSDGAYP